MSSPVEFSPRYSKVSRRIWADARFRRLSAPPPNGQTLFLRLLTAPELGTIPGLICMGEMAMAEALEWPLEGFREAFGEVFAEGLAKADWKARLVFVPKALRHNKPESPNVIRGWRSTWDLIPECSLKTEAYQTLKAFAEAFGEGFAKAFAQALAKPSPNQEQEQEQEQEQDLERERRVPRTPPTAPKVRPKSTKGSRLPDAWQPSVDVIVWAKAQGIVNPLASLDDFTDYWKAASGARAVKADWDATYRSWVRKDLRDGRLEVSEAPLLAHTRGHELSGDEPAEEDPGPPVSPEVRAQRVREFNEMLDGIKNAPWPASEKA